MNLTPSVGALQEEEEEGFSSAKQNTLPAYYIGLPPSSF
jgi:hypothetical protein